MDPSPSGVNAFVELRLVLTVADFEVALAFYRDALGLEELPAWEDQEGRVAILDAGRATLELVDEGQAEAIDRIEVGRRVAGPVRVAFQVDDSDATAERLVTAGAVLVAGPITTPWSDRNVRLTAPDGTQLTLFSSLE
jgi:catechol 2,3-dioxygenase-like lactoylglutathione lyase family enzyme